MKIPKILTSYFRPEGDEDSADQNSIKLSQPVLKQNTLEIFQIEQIQFSHTSFFHRINIWKFCLIFCLEYVTGVSKICVSTPACLTKIYILVAKYILLQFTCFKEQGGGCADVMYVYRLYIDLNALLSITHFLSDVTMKF